MIKAALCIMHLYAEHFFLSTRSFKISFGHYGEATTSKCPLCLFLLMAGVVPVLNSITPSLPLTSLCETDSVLTILRIFGLLVISIAFVSASIICGTSKIKSPLSFF